MPQPRSVQAAAASHVRDWGDTESVIRLAVDRVLGGVRRNAARQVVGTVRTATARLEAAAVSWASDELAGVYRLGVQVAGSVTGVPLLGELMEAEVAAIVGEHVDETVRVAAGVRRGAAGFRVPAGLPVLSPAEIAGLSPGELADLLEHPIGLVRYRDGSYRGIGDHGDMLVRTRVSTAYNRAAIDVARAADVGWVECADGVGCGWTAHEDGSSANGEIVEVDFAAAHLLAHPRCQRSFRPRPDITSSRRASTAARLGLPFDDEANPLPLPGPTIQPRPRVQRSRATRAVRARRALRRR